MPKRTDIHSILIVGAGPIVIGQACEFDYSGTQACKALREEGYRVILLNSNPATIMTDPELADATYVEPITAEIIERIIEREKPDALLPTMGGQTALNVAMQLHESGALERLGVELIGARAEAIAKAEDRDLFRKAMRAINLDLPRSHVFTGTYESVELTGAAEAVRLTAESWATAQDALKDIGLPCVIRPAFTLGGSGGGIAYNLEEFQEIITSGVEASPINQVLIEESVLGWKEFEMEVVRDRNDNCIIICSIENVDPMGIHTGDSITVAPALTLTDKEYQIMRNASLAVLREIGVDTGGSNVQFAVNPENGRMVVIEMNPRVSRSSALASKATGFPIAKVAAKLAIGYTLDELGNDITGGLIPASFEPTIDYVVTKIPRFTFEKFPGTEPVLTTSMRSVGEAMAMGRTFAESLQKGLRSLETGLTGFNEQDIDGAEGGRNRDAIARALSTPRPERLLVIAQALRFGMTVDEVAKICKYDPWFIARIQEIVQAEAGIRDGGLPETADAFHRIKAMGFSDDRLAELTGQSAAQVAEKRRALGLSPVYKRVDSCAAEFPSATPYLYGAYEGGGLTPGQCEADPSDQRKVVILGGGPNRIGQGIEFDYCCCHAAFSLKEAGYETIMVNCNPETVSTDYDTSDRLYFEPLTDEDVIELIRREQSRGELHGVIVQFGGQTPLKLAQALEDAQIPILGTSPDAIDLAEDRERFQALLRDLGLRQPRNGIARSVDEAVSVAETIGYPVVIRPSYVLGGRAMEIVYDQAGLLNYMEHAVKVSGKSPVLLDSFLTDAIEVDVDAISDGDEVFVAGIMQHIEEAGVHSGDSACSLPPYSLESDVLVELKRQTRLLAKGLGVVGLMNVQFALQGGDVYILEVNPRASRTVPFVAKATGVPVAKIAARVMAGEKLSAFDVDDTKPLGHTAVKEAVFPFNRFPGVDVILGPEMKSTGEVMGVDKDFGLAFAKSQIGSGAHLPKSGTVFLSIRPRDKTPRLLDLAKRLVDLDFKLMATGGTADFLRDAGFPVTPINKVTQGRPHCVDALKSKQIQLVINTTEGAQSILDSFPIRRTALTHGVAHYTTLPGAFAAVDALEAVRNHRLEVKSLQDHTAT